MQDIFLLLLPLTNALVASFMFFPFITFKALSLRVLTALALIFTPKINIDLKEKIFTGVVLFLLASLFSTIFSLSPYRSFWGNAERMEGWWSLFIYFILFLVLREIFLKNKGKIKLYLGAFVIFGILATLSVLPQWLKDIKIRPEGIMGNGAYMGIVGMSTFFISLFLLEFESKSKWFNLLNYLGLIFGFGLLIISQTRSAFLGFIAGILVYGFLKLPPKGKIALFFLILIFLGSLAFLPPQAFPLPIFSRLSEIFHGQITGSAFTRLTVWQMFLKAWQEKPILGYGPELSPYIFGRYLNPHLFEVERAIFDRAHNKYVELLATQGILGLGSYLFLLGVIFYTLFKLNRLSYNFSKSLIGFFTAFTVNNFFIFDIQYTWMIFFGLAAWLSSFFNSKSSKNIDFSILKPFLGVVIILICILNFYQIRSVIKVLREGTFEQLLKVFPQVGPYQTELVIHTASRFVQNLSQDQAFNYYNLVAKAYLQEPTDLRLSSFYFSLGFQLYNLFSPEEKEFFEKNVEKYINNFPLWPHAILVSFKYYLDIKNQPLKTLEILNKIKQYPAYIDYQPTIAYEIYKKGMVKEAYELLKELKDKGFKFDDKVQAIYDEIFQVYSLTQNTSSQEEDKNLKK